MRAVGISAFILFAIGCGASATPSGSNVEGLPATGSQPPVATSATEMIDNPQYMSWANFPKGTSVVYREVTRQNDTETVTIKTFTLADITADVAEVTMQQTTTGADGVTTEYPAMTFQNGRKTPAPSGRDAKRHGKAGIPTEEGEETLELAGRKYKTTWYKTKGRVEAGEELIQIWSSSEVPSGLVKSVNEVPAAKKFNSVELIEIRLPKK